MLFWQKWSHFICLVPSATIPSRPPRPPPCCSITHHTSAQHQSSYSRRDHDARATRLASEGVAAEPPRFVVCSSCEQCRSVGIPVVPRPPSWSPPPRAVKKESAQCTRRALVSAATHRRHQPPGGPRSQLTPAGGLVLFGGGGCGLGSGGEQQQGSQCHHEGGWQQHEQYGTELWHRRSTETPGV